MLNSSSSSKSPLSQEIENPIHSISQFLLLKALRPYHLWVLSNKESKNSKSQSVVKPTLETQIKDLEVVSQPGDMSSTMSERLFERDLPEGKGMESNILAAAEEFVVVQSLASLRGDTQSILLEQEYRSLE
ncbi:hypothetical protein H5410_031197 [Solanum commersonii]|uniref:Uncharacterized protein n=1 Tax=Solanum commersonii TaxID=4109 RepID=A0A9J5YGG4_SOLCO|nr:hypothetical protein H5410_031197 [Solanum commersonii]